MRTSAKYNNLSDKELVEVIRKNKGIEEKSYLFKRYIEKIFGLCLKYLKNESDAEDAVMSIYELFLRKIETNKVENVNAWIYVVSKNYCLDLLRKRKRTDVKKEAYLSVQSEAFYHPYNEDVLETQLMKLETCIKQLNPEQAQVVELFYKQKMSYDEISSSLSLTWSKIRSRIQNARRNLKKCMEQI